MNEKKKFVKKPLVIISVVVLVIVAVTVIMIISSQRKVTLDAILEVNSKENVLKSKRNVLLYNGTSWYYEKSGEFINFLVETNEEKYLIEKDNVFVFKNGKEYYLYEAVDLVDKHSFTMSALDKYELVQYKKSDGKYIIETQHPQLNEYKIEVTVDKRFFIERVYLYNLNNNGEKELIEDIKFRYNIKKDIPKITDDFFNGDDKAKITITKGNENSEFEIVKGKMFGLKHGDWVLYTDPEGLNLYGDGYFSTEPITEDLQLYAIRSK